MFLDKTISRAENVVLKDFCETYIRYAECFILIDSDEMDNIDKLEREVLTGAYIGSLPPLFQNKSVREIKLHFIRERIRVMEEAMEKYPNLANVKWEFQEWLKRNQSSVKKINLSFKSDELTSQEIYANYIFVVKYLDAVKLALHDGLKNK